MTDEKTEGAEPTTDEKPEKVKMPSANGVTRPKPNTATGRVWEIADDLSKAASEPAKRSDVLKAFEAEGGNASTGATQYGRWRKFHGLGRYATQKTTEGASEDAPVVE